MGKSGAERRDGSEKRPEVRGMERWPGPSASRGSVVVDQGRVPGVAGGVVAGAGRPSPHHTAPCSRGSFVSCGRATEKAQVGWQSCFYLEVSFKFQMISASCALETRSALPPAVAGTEPSPGLREPC